MEIYRLWVKYVPAVISGLQSGIPADFADGPHGEIRLHIDDRMWTTNPADKKGQELARQAFGAVNGDLGYWVGGGNIEMKVRGRTVGTLDFSPQMRTNLEGLIGTQSRSAGGGIEVFTRGYYFTRPPAWADHPPIEKLAILLDRAKQYSDPEIAAMIDGFIAQLPLFVAIFLLMLALGAAGGATIALVVGVIVQGATMYARSEEYWEQLKVVNDVMNITDATPPHSELDRGGRALAAFFRMVVEDCALALAMHAAGKAAGRYRKSKIKESTETIEEAFTRHKAEFEEGQRKAAAKSPKDKPMAAEADYTASQMHVANEHAFKDMPSFRGKTYSQLKAWLLENGFVWQKKAIYDGNKGGNANAGGSEIWVRRTNPEMANAKLAEVIRVDEQGHSQMQKDGPITTRTNPRTGMPQQERGHGAVGHFHKDIVPTDRLATYQARFVQKIKSVQDNGNLVVDGPTYFEQTHIQIVDDR